jgi:hypothetical protein
MAAQRRICGVCLRRICWCANHAVEGEAGELQAAQARLAAAGLIKKDSTRQSSSSMGNSSS